MLFKYKLSRAVLFFLGLFLLFIILIRLSLGTIISAMVKSAGHDLSLSVDSVWIDAIEFSHIDFNHGLVTIPKLKISFGWKELKSKMVNEIMIVNPTIDLRKIPPKESPSKKEGLNLSPAFIPFHKLTLENIKLKTKKSPINLPVQLMISRDGKNVSLELKELATFDLNGEKIYQVRIDLNGSFDKFWQGKMFAKLNDKFENTIEVKDWSLNEGNLLIDGFKAQIRGYQVNGKQIEYSLLDGKYEFTPISIEAMGEERFFRKLNMTSMGGIKDHQLSITNEQKTLLLKGDVFFKENVQLQTNFIKVSLNDIFETFPIVKKYFPITLKSGQLKYRAKYNAEKLSLTGVIFDASFDYENIKFDDLSLTFDLQDITQLTPKGWQVLKIKNINLGPKLQDLELVFKPDGFDLWLIDHLKLSIGGGQVATGKTSLDFIKKTMPPTRIELDEIPLDYVLKQFLKNEADATGKLKGTIDIEMQDSVPVIKNGKLSSKSKGIIKYAPTTANPLAQTDQASVNILLDYLKNFAYDEIELNIRSDKEYNTKIVMTLLGKNPQVFKGRPLKFSLNLEFNWLKMLKSTIGSLKISDKLESKIIKGLVK